MGCCQPDYEHLDPKEQGSHYKKIIAVIVVVSLVLILACSALTGILVYELAPHNDDNDIELPDGVFELNLDNVNAHLIALNNIGKNNGNTRALGTPGYNASLNYVYNQLTQAGYKPFVQSFNVDYFQLSSTPVFKIATSQNSFVYNQNFLVATHSGSTPANGLVAPVTQVNQVDKFGCTQAAYAGFTAGNFALVNLGGCTFEVQAQQAITAGATALIIIFSNDEYVGGLFANNTLPVIVASSGVGQALTPGTQVSANITIVGQTIPTQTWNIIADTANGNPNATIVVGSHLDSVPEGPGINDNGSGTSINLALALQVASQNYNLVNRIRFAWWGAEEEGLLGSTFYVEDLVKNNMPALNQIVVNINMDMVGSPNFQRGIYDGKSAEDQNIVVASTLVQTLFTSVFSKQNLTFEYVPFDGRSDYGPFIANGIPAGGLFTGAEEIKTIEGRAMYGGLADTPYDPCYHQLCDSYANINQDVLYEMGNACLTVTLQLAQLPNLAMAMNRTVASNTPSTPVRSESVTTSRAFVHPAQSPITSRGYNQRFSGLKNLL